MITVSTAWNAGFKCYGFACGKDLEELKRKLLESGHEVVHLIRVDPWDDIWSYEKSRIPVVELSEADLAWLGEPQASGRYLVCRL
jgi:hypothetical protein